MQHFFPILTWLKSYKKGDFIKDLLAGFTVGIILIPQGMAYAMIAGLPPVYGLYAALFPTLMYVFLGTSRQLAVGPVAMDSLLVAAGLGALSLATTQDYIAMAIVLGFMVGATQFLLGLFRMGFLVNFMSKPVISGFTSGAAIIIMFSQLKHLLGANIEGSSKFVTLIKNVFAKVAETNMYDFAIGMVGILIIVVVKKINKKIPSILFVVVLGILAVYFFKLEQYGVKIVGAIPDGLPSFGVPNINIKNILDIWPIAVTLALVGYLEAISIGKALEEKSGKETINPNQELIAIGSANMVGSFFKSFPVTASFSRSAINYEAGAKTNLASLFSVIMVVVVLLFLTPLFFYLPKAVLASIIMVSVFGLIDIAYPKELWKHRKDEFLVLLATFICTVFIGIKEGILVGVLFSLLLMVYRTSKPHFAVLGNVKGTDYYKNVSRFGTEVITRDDLLIVRFDAQLYFGNASYFKTELYKHIHKKGAALKGVILNAEAINYIDSSAAQMLEKVIREIHEKNIQFYVAGAIGPARDIIFTSGIITELHREFLFVKTSEAVTYFDEPKEISMLRAKVAHQKNFN
ncbi:sulfate transporter [Cellulophaga lytica]|uniref:Sulfate transporter n=1 Tax=Cellulophaga lytica (strain ATCC 23178 / DSM 7489 / JCM 8516 / NBRC 14961 / NCIMB 1423 / VKM B-1433 / Cy l20) TaxID=867900 RepID=F0RFQ3_CELLC|nr:solute carrier family 26 protein [Cellulophaga lytica]ADY30028.1 sulfate transporter [Cellulophaga lytica DSM 7489]AIM61021.1 sulfate transporter [Cellulophaga lytica]WQG75809.1 solute carrier family 26 protein [Cellulophaga lytica]